jgi:hypothetical protein
MVTKTVSYSNTRPCTLITAFFNHLLLNNNNDRANPMGGLPHPLYTCFVLADFKNSQNFWKKHEKILVEAFTVSYSSP